MYNHALKNYDCPFCAILDSIEKKGVLTKKSDIFYKNDKITAFMSTHTWSNNKGNILIIPNKHFENIYDLQEEYGNEIFKMTKNIAIAMKKIYKCDGTSIRQHNEPAGNQHVFHYHMHVLPRYKGDKLYQSYDKKVFIKPEDRQKYADKLKQYFSENKLF